MRGIGTPWRAALAMVLTLASLFAMGPAALAQGGTRVRTLADGFEMPLGLAVAKDGTVYVASGAGLTRLRQGRERVVYTREGASFAGVDVTRQGKVVFTEVLGTPGPGGNLTDTLLRQLKGKNDARTLASLLKFEQRRNPDADQRYGLVDTPQACLDELPPEVQPHGGEVDSNPYAVATTRNGDRLVADAGGNTIVRVPAKGGKVSLVAVLPPIPTVVTEAAVQQAEEEFQIELDECIVGEAYNAEPVPTDVEVAKDGRLYVSVLPGFPGESQGEGAVFRIDPRSGRMKEVASGFEGAVDIALGKRTIYVAELFGGRISMVRRGEISTVVEVPFPGTVERGRDGKLYATTDVLSPNGKVVRIGR